MSAESHEHKSAPALSRLKKFGAGILATAGLLSLQPAVSAADTYSPTVVTTQFDQLEHDVANVSRIARTDSTGVIGGVGDPSGMHQPRLAKQYRQGYSITIPYSASRENMPGAVEEGKWSTIRTPAKTIVAWSLGAQAASAAIASGKMPPGKTIVLVGNPSSRAVRGFKYPGIAYAPLPLPRQLQAYDTSRYNGKIIEVSRIDDPIANLNPGTPGPVAVADYFNSHAGYGASDYNSFNRKHKAVVTRGNTTHVIHF